MNWSEPSIRAEQALKRANHSAELGHFEDAMINWDLVVKHADEAFDALEKLLSEQREKTQTTTP